MSWLDALMVGFTSGNWEVRSSKEALTKEHKKSSLIVRGTTKFTPKVLNSKQTTYKQTELEKKEETVGYFFGRSSSGSPAETRPRLVMGAHVCISLKQDNGEGICLDISSCGGRSQDRC